LFGHTYFLLSSSHLPESRKRAFHARNVARGHAWPEGESLCVRRSAYFDWTTSADRKRRLLWALHQNPRRVGKPNPTLLRSFPLSVTPLLSLYERLVRTCRRTCTSCLHSFRGIQLPKMVFPQPAGLQKGKETNSSSLSSLANHIRSLFVLAHRDEGGMPQVSRIGPFKECDLADQLGFDPAALLHFLCG
jgi:hypothetical protein